MSEKLLFADELARALRRGRTYIYAMKRAGFQMPGGTATLEEAREWLRNHPNFIIPDAYGPNARPKPTQLRGLRRE